MFIFDGPNKRIHICEECAPGGVARFTVNQLWSRYVDWVAQDDNSKYPPAMRVIGGDSIGSGQYVGTYLFFRNDLGWRGVPPPVDGVTIIIDGSLYGQDAMLPVMENLPNQQTDLVINRSTLVTAVSTSGAPAPTAQEVAAATVSLLTSRIIENGMTNDDLTRLMASVLLGKLSGAGSGYEIFRDLADTKDRVKANIDNSGNRLAIVLDASE